MALPASQLPFEIIREVRQRKWIALLVFVAVCLAVLATGFLWHYKYQSQVVIFVDDSNIIKPLMAGSAVTTTISDRASEAEQLLISRDLLSKVGKDTSIFGADADSLEGHALEQRLDGIRSGIRVVALGRSYFGIRYTAHDPEKAFLVAQKLGQLFIEESERRKKQESRSAYDFIDKQVKAYEQQLQQSEENLKDFLAQNTDGTESEADRKIAEIRGKIELAKLDLQEAQSERSALQQQLVGVRDTVTQGQTEDVFQTRINNLQQQLDNLRLKYKDSYPDIINLKQQIIELKKQHAAAIKDKSADQVTQGQEVINPLYQSIKSQLATAAAKIDSTKTRLNALNGMLDQEKVRMKRIQANKARYAELTRGMQVNKEIYDNLLRKRETARVSMRLDFDGQGLSYHIQESAQYPLAPVGPKFPYFAAAGLLLGLCAPFGLAAGLLRIDPRVRSREVIEDDLGVPVLTVIPEVRTPFEHRQDRRRTLIIGLIAMLVVAGYSAIALLHIMGVF
ncbi:XrtA system polysaccharide chain length determinant [Mangrovitalea sediminis]|uniref:XrtA system polysaccharide chain length determinant n=1 Tax=Mangrovitalea sediminis TaxID=1982043 RepID=UPI000BE6122B|nr:XrtA system polysaccharide chain length determinant [Mangrovitalea sediminis]